MSLKNLFRCFDTIFFIFESKMSSFGDDFLKNFTHRIMLQSFYHHIVQDPLIQIFEDICTLSVKIEYRSPLKIQIFVQSTSK